MTRKILKNIIRSISALGLPLLLVAASSSVAYASSEFSNDSKLDVKATLNSTSEFNGAGAPGLLEGALARTSGVKQGVAMNADFGAAAVNFPVDPKNGIAITSKGMRSLKVSLPFAGLSEDASQVSPGVVSYDNKNGSITAPILKQNGSLQIVTILKDSSAPQRYEYALSMLPGERLEKQQSGAVVMKAADGQIVGEIAAPWAKDATGAGVSTKYEISGNKLTQVVEHVGKNNKYPIVADPTFDSQWWGIAAKLTQSETNWLAGQIDGGNGAAAFCGFVPNSILAVGCALAVGWRIDTWAGPIKEASSQGRCAQINFPWASGPVLWNVTNEQC